MHAGNDAAVLTIGYGRRDFAEAINLLHSHRVGYVIDVRSSPWSRWQPEFSQEPLVTSLREHGIRYVFMGDVLGGRPEAAECYDAEGHVDYVACRRQPAFQQGIARLASAARAGFRVAVMCSEGRPEDCHRTKLVAPALIAEGIDVLHVDEHGTVASHEEILDRLRANQMALAVDDGPGLLHRSRGRYRTPA